MVWEIQNQFLIPPFFKCFCSKNEDLLSYQMIRDQDKMLFIDCKKFHFKKNIPGNETKHFGIDYRNEALIPWFNISESRLFEGLKIFPSIF